MSLNRKKFILPIIGFFLAGCIVALAIWWYPIRVQNDVLRYSRIASEAGIHWDDLSQGEYDTSVLFCIVSLSDEILFENRGDKTDKKNDNANPTSRRIQQINRVPHTVTEALKNGDCILDVTQNGSIVGKVLIASSIQSEMKQMIHRLAISVFCFFVLLTVFLCFTYHYLHRHIIRPFHKLEQFATEISHGNLDFPLLIEKDNIFGAFTESFDLMREQLRITHQKEKLAAEQKNELVAELSHDIKTPITSIRLTSELLMELTDDPVLSEKLQVISQKSEQIDELITNLFQTTLRDLNQLSVTPASFYSSDLGLMIREADYYDKTTISEIPICLLSFDKLRLSQVISNIIVNSYKYANTEIKVDCDLTDTHLSICFRDYGPGVAEEEIPLLFNKFYRGKNAATESGSGLGLYICKRLMEQMQGDIYCRCERDGFCVIVLIKLTD